MVDLFNPTDEHHALRRMVREFTEKEIEPQALAADAAETFDRPLFERLGALGLLGITVDERFGGSAMDPLAAVIVHEEISASDPGFCLAYLAHSMLFVNNLQVNGSDEQRMKWLPPACSGEAIGGMCMSEPGAGTDVLGMATTARKDGNEYVINGAKLWITNGALDDHTLGDIFLVYARTGGSRRDVSLFLVDRDNPGLKLGQRLKHKLGMRASGTAELVFEDCRVTTADLVGAEGDAVLHMMKNLEIERLTLAAMSLGIARRCIQTMNRYASERKSFGRPIRQFGQIQRYIAESYAEYMAGRSYVYHTAGQLGTSNAHTRLDSDGVKLYCSTMAKNVADRAIQVLGGYGYMGEYHVERLWRDAKLLEIGGGTLEAHQKNMTNDLEAIDTLK
ncbi:MAG: acyl-CoA dehydrogenase family protein [Myxococcota bacterium]|nr:acyl-CoA dehydrogenase family protein [Myxococcota bacterium]